MPSRIIREGWLESETVNQLDAATEVFFLRLCLKADDFGRYHANPVLLGSVLFPLREDVKTSTVKNWLAACERAGLLRCYVSNAKDFLEIVKFGQRIKNGCKSKFPEPPASIPPLPAVAGLFPENPGTAGKNPPHSEAEAEAEAEAKPYCEGSSEPSADAEAQEQPASVVLRTFPTVGRGGTQWNYTEDVRDSLAKAFPSVNLELEVERAWLWIDCNPTNRKTASGMKSFLMRWMERAQNNGSGSRFSPSITPAVQPARIGKAY